MATEAPPAAPAVAPAIKPLACPSCGGSIEVKAAGYTVTIVCRYCSSVLDVANPDVRIIQEYHEAAAELEIPLGTRGTLKGIEWEAIGYVARSDGDAGWEEYLLFNPYHGYRWLVTDGRGWSFGTMLTSMPTLGPTGEMVIDGQAHKSFWAGGSASVDYVLGEFYWRVAVGESVSTADYVRPGFMLSWEKNASEISWTLLELLDLKEMQAQFGVGKPRRSWPPMPHQPSPYGKAAKAAFKMGAIAFLALLVLTMLFGGSGALLQETVRVAPDREGRTITLGPVELKRPYQAVTIAAQADAIDNQWVDLDYSLVDRATQESYDAYGAVEYYSGYDSDGSWTEGSRATATKLAMVPKGSYDLVVDLAGHNWNRYSSDPFEVRVSVAQGVRFWSNIIIAFLLLGIPLFLIVRKHFKFESARQAESDSGGISAIFDGDDDDE